MLRTPRNETKGPAGATLTKIVLLNDQQPFVTLSQRLAYTPTIAQVIRPAQYERPELSDFLIPSCFAPIFRVIRFPMAL